MQTDAARMKKKPYKERSLGTVKILGNADFNMPFYLQIGNLVVSWANNESVFLAMLQVLLIGGEKAAAIVWNSHQNTRARLELVRKLCRERVTDTDLLAKIETAISNFAGHTRVRNFYCHAMYRYDDKLCLLDATGTKAQQEGNPIAFETKRMDHVSLNEITNTTVNLALFNRELWRLVEQLQTELGVQRVVPPPLPLALEASQDGLTRPETDGTPEGKP
jgi:hypothetical protein